MSLSANKLIIIIDDDEDDCYFLQLGIQRNLPDYKILTITDSFRVVEQLRNLHTVPALILLDLYMPLNGIDVLTQIRELPRYASVPVAILSGLIDLGELTGIQKMGISYAMQKPSTLHEIAALLTKLLT